MAHLRASSTVAVAAALLFGCSDPPSTQTVTSYPPAPAGIDLKLSTYLEASKSHQHNVWRDAEPLNADGTVNGYIEIPKGESTKWEFSIPLNRLEVDRMIPRELGGYPTNYGFLPQTISYDGDPADVLVLGPALPGGEIVKGRIVGLMQMIDDGDPDSKVVISPLDRAGAAAFALEAGDRDRLERFFNIYKNHEGKATRITGWDDDAAALTFLNRTAAFFQGAQR